ncbi:hypothetical protein [Streptomyces sp. YS-3]|uniref:hypothetical protein n=1 Tax=Streptomyces sp. YS-3 TaxID=3381352 RepID=UPI00386277EF
MPTLGWEGRHWRVLGDIHWSHGDTAQAAAAFEAGRTEAEQHQSAGERALLQVRLAQTFAFADPARTDDELAFAHQLLDGLDQRANTLRAHIAALIRDAGAADVTDRAHSLRTGIDTSGLPYLHRFVELALAFHRAVCNDAGGLAATVGRLHELTDDTGDFSHFIDIAHFMADLPLPSPTATRWIDGNETVRNRWRHLVTTRQALLEGERNS